MMIDPAYLQFCQTETQRKVVQAVIDHGSNRKASAAIGINVRGVEKHVAAVKLAAERRGYSPAHDLNHPTAPSQLLAGASTLYKDGNPVLQWVKTKVDDTARLEAMRAAVEAFKDDLPKYLPTPPPAKFGNSDLLNLYTITDYHFGMLSWAEETGADWDTDIAERTLIDWFAAAIKSAPAAESAVFAQLGDFLHFDGFDAVTPTSRHLLDVDTRFQRVVRVVIRTLRRIIGMLLAKYKHVTIIMADANHDPASGIWLREWLASVYEDEPRITVDNSADTFYRVRFGNSLLMFHHGHKVKMEVLDTVMVAKFREDYGQTTHHYAYTGHLHHDRRNETRLMIVEQFRTLAAQDAYASRNGYISGRDAKVITHHRQHGEVARLTINYDMVKQ